jgi:hypothetical protein
MINSVLIVHEGKNDRRYLAKIESVDWFVWSELRKKKAVVLVHHTFLEEFVVCMVIVLFLLKK